LSRRRRAGSRFADHAVAGVLSIELVRLAILGSHPIPYRTPLYRLLARQPGLEILVLYGDDYGVRARPSPWGVERFRWDGDHVGGYPHRFLPNWNPRPNPSTFFGKLNPGLGRALYEFRATAALVTGYASAYHLQGIGYAWRSDLPIIYTADSNVLRDPGGVRGWVKHSVIEPLYRRVTAFLTTGTRNREHFARFGVPSGRMFSFPWAVDMGTLRTPDVEWRENRRLSRTRWGIGHKTTCALFVGRLAPEKGIADLVRAVAEVPGLHLLVAGSGPLLHDLEQLANEVLPGRITFAGFLNQRELSHAYAAADFLCLPSRFEAWGLVCNEAMHFGLPIVVSDRVGAAPDLVEGQGTGWVFRSGDVGDLARCLRQAVAGVNSDRQGFTTRTRNWIGEFSYEAQAKGVVEALAYACPRTESTLTD